jgi:hypothetical protein
MSNVTMTLSGDRTGSITTLPDGTYSFTDLPGGGNYTITPSYPKFVFSQSSRTVTNLSANQVNQLLRQPANLYYLGSNQRCEQW